jgi:hypothetical protein
MQGNCPKCGEPLDYDGQMDNEDSESIFYECDCPKCGFVGRECYGLTFIGFQEVGTGEWMDADALGD